MRTLFIMQHAHVETVRQDANSTFTLTNKAKRSAQRLGVWLQANNCIPDHVVSTAQQPVKTMAEKMCKAAGLSSNHIRVEEGLSTSTTHIIKGMKTVPQAAQSVLIVAGYASADILLTALLDTPVTALEQQPALTSARLVRLGIPGRWNTITTHSAELVEIVYADNLPSRFPYPDVNGLQQRIRPAYYYKQSSVIPYRIKEQQLQILIIASSSNSHWVVPKGIQEPGLSAQQSAAREAYEEAGIEGEVAEKAIGHYTYEKWQANCNVTVFPMLVQRLLEENEWQEHHRSRRWITVTEAVDLLHNKQLAAIVADLPAYLEPAAHD